MSAPGWVKLSRSLLDWEWMGDPNVVTVYLQVLLRANYEAKRWQGIDIPAGSVLTSHASLAKSCGLSEKQTRRALEVLKQGRLVDTKRAGQGQLVSLLPCGFHDGDGSEQGRLRADQRAGRGQTEGRLRADRGQQLKKDKKERSREVATEVATASAGSELPLGLEPIQNTPPSSAEPPSKANPDVSFVVEHLTGRLQERGLARALDPSEQSNRRYAYLLIQRLAKDYPSVAPREVAERLIDFATGHPVHGGRCTHVKYLFYNIGTLTNDARKSRSGGSDDYARRAAEAAARRFAEGAEHAGATPAGDAVPVGE